MPAREKLQEQVNILREQLEQEPPLPSENVKRWSLACQV